MRAKHTLLIAANCVLLALPWLNPFTYGPTTSAFQWAICWLCASLAAILKLLGGTSHQSTVNAIVMSWVLAASLSAGIGLIQYFGVSQHFSPFASYVEAGQAYANLRQRNHLATLLAIGLCAMLWLRSKYLNSPVAGFRWSAIVWCYTAMLICAADAATGSRTGLMQLLLLLALSACWKRHRMALFGICAVYLIAAAILPKLAGLEILESGILGRIGDTGPVCASRITLWGNVLQLIQQKPWLGWGWGELAYAHFITLYPNERFCAILGNAHNLPLHLAVELGAPLALIVCSLGVWLLWRAKPWQERDPTRQLGWSVIAVIGMHSLLEYPMWYGPFQLSAMLAIWMLCRSTREIQSDQPHKTTALHWIFAVSVLWTCCFVVFDYWRISQIYLPLSQRAAMYREDTLAKTSGSWIFQDQVKFAELGVTPLNSENASHIHALALEMLHFSPEAFVVEKLIESAKMLGNEAEVQFYSQRFELAYPNEYASWLKGSH